MLLLGKHTLKAAENISKSEELRVRLAKDVEPQLLHLCRSSLLRQSRRRNRRKLPSKMCFLCSTNEEQSGFWSLMLDLLTAAEKLGGLVLSGLDKLLASLDKLLVSSQRAGLGLDVQL